MFGFVGRYRVTINPGLISLPRNNGNRTEWSQLLSVITRVVSKMRRPPSGSRFDLFITTMKNSKNWTK